MDKDYEIPDSYDPIWQSQMLREMEENLKILKTQSDNELLNDCLSIVRALRQYSD